MDQQPETAGDGQSDTVSPPLKRRSYTWHELMARVFLFDFLECPRCGGRMKALIITSSNLTTSAYTGVIPAKAGIQ
jgi:hypothetical protein